MSESNPNGACIEKGVWTPLPNPVPSTTNFVFTPATAGNMTFHMVGCSGDPSITGPGLAVAGGMAAQVVTPASAAVSPSFLYHLGDLAYTTSGSDMTGALWNTQFYAQYAAYKDGNGPLPIFAIAGNHDGNTGTSPDTEIGHFEQNICGTAGTVSPDNQDDTARTETALPYPYWRLDTPLAWIIGLYANVSNGGVLDDPTEYTDPTQGPQYQWLVQQLSWCKAQNATGTPRAVLLAVHYPPYNGTLDFQQRGNPTFGNDNAYPNAIPIGMVQLMATECAGGTGSFPAAPFNLFTQGTPPVGLTAPANATVTIDFYADGTNQENQPYGFLTVTLVPGSATTHPTMLCQFYTTPCNSLGDPVKPGALFLTDSCALDLATHLLLS